MKQKLPDEASHRPQWTPATIQHLRLKMAYKSKTKIKGENHETDQKKSDQGSNIAKHITQPNATSLDPSLHII